MKKTPLAKQTAAVSGGGGGKTPPPRPVPVGDVQIDNPPPPKKEGQPDVDDPPPRNREPSGESKSRVEQLKSDQDARLDALFAGEDPPDPPSPPKKKEEPPPKKEEPPPSPKKEEPPPPKEEEGDDLPDFDKPPAGTEEHNRESIAQQQARENGQKLKALETQHQETVLELQRTKDELDLLKKSGAGQPQYREEDFARHPEVTPIRRDIITDRNAVAQTQTYPQAGKVITSKFGDYMSHFLARNAEQDESAAQAMDVELRNTIAEDFRTAFKEAHGENFNEQEMETESRAFTRDVLQLLVRNAGKTQQVQEKISTLAAKAREGMLAEGVEVYQFHENDLKTAINAIPEIPQAVIDENPHTVEATVAVLLKQPGWRERFERTQKEILELLLGPRVLTQKDLDNMKTGGVDVREFSKQRQKSFLEKRRKLAVAITQSLLLRGRWEDMSRKASAHDDSNNELDIISRAKPKDSDPPPAPQPKKKASEFVSAIEPHLEEVEKG